MKHQNLNACIIAGVCCMFAINTLVSCRGAGSRKAASEAMEYIEKKASGSVERGASSVERSVGKDVEEEYGHQKGYRPRPRHDYNQNSYNTMACPQCQGHKFVYLVDNYGNYITDYNGNYQTITCPTCGGNGVVATEY